MERKKDNSGESLLSAIARGSRLFLTVELDLESSIPSFLEILGRASGVTRCYLFRNCRTDSGDPGTSLQYEWARSGFERNSSKFLEIPWTRSGMDRWLRELSAGNPVHGILEDLPDEESEVLYSQSVRSVAVFPVFVNGQWWGFLGIHDCENDRRWRKDEIEALSIGSAIIETALERKEMEVSLRSTRDRYVSLLSAIPSIVLYIERGGRITDCSQHSRDILGFPPEELIGSEFLDLCSTTDGMDLAAELERSFETGTHLMKEMLVRDSDGVPRDARVIITPIPESPLDEKRYAVVHIEDITSYRRIELENRSLEEQINRRNRMDGMAILAGGIAHDFSGIMSVISWNAKLALRDLPRGKSRSSIERILTATERSQELAQQMLSYAGRGYYNPIRVSIKRLAMEICSLIKPSLPEGITMECDFQDDLPEIEADPTQVDQLMMNLLKNSIESMGDRSGVIEITGRLVSCGEECFKTAYYGKPPDPGEYILLTVRDQGSGMSQNTMGKLFDPFFTTKSNGRGLGLSVVLGIVRAHNGAIQVRSELEAGSEFSVYMPLSAGIPDINAAEPIIP